MQESFWAGHVNMRDTPDDEAVNDPKPFAVLVFLSAAVAVFPVSPPLAYSAQEVEGYTTTSQVSYEMLRQRTLVFVTSSVPKKCSF